LRSSYRPRPDRDVIDCFNIWIRSCCDLNEYIIVWIGSCCDMSEWTIVWIDRFGCCVRDYRDVSECSVVRIADYRDVRKCCVVWIDQIRF
jgi:hypothetical protein